MLFAFIQDMKQIRQKIAARTISLIGLLLIGCVFISNSSYGQTSHQRINQTFEKAITDLMDQQGLVSDENQRASYQINNLDPRLQLADCGSALEVELKYQRLPGRVTGKISCTSPQPWTIYSTAKIELFQSVVAAAAPLTRNQRVDASQLILVEKEVSALRQGYFTRIADIDGKETRRAIAFNSVISPDMLIEPVAVEKGDEVVIEAKGSNLAVRSAGIALTKGRIGERINVRNSSSKRTIKAMVVAKGRVEVIL